MNLSSFILKRKLTTLFLIVISVAAFATLGNEGGKKKSLSKKNFLSHKPSYNYKNFSLKTGYNYRGMNVFSQSRSEGKYILLNNVVTHHEGNTTYITPLKRKPLGGKVKFNLTPDKY